MRPSSLVTVLLACALVAPALLAGKRQPQATQRIFLVGGETAWVDTGIEVREEELLTVRAGSEVCFSGGAPESCVRAGGMERQEYESAWPGDAAACEDPFPEWPHAALIAEVGGEAVLAGKSLRIEGRRGALRLGINDCSVEGEHGNVGELSVVVVVEDPAALAMRLGEERIEQTLEALGGDALDDLESLVARAACTGPGGEFTTEVHSLPPDRTFFRQSSDDGVVELVVRHGKAFRVDRETGRWKKAGAEVRDFVRSHEFHFLFFELDERFDRHTLPLPAEDAGEPAAEGEEGCVRVEMVDRHGAPAAVCIDDESGRPRSLSFQPGGKRKEPAIHLRVDGWREIDGVFYVEAFTLEHGDEVFTYDYETLEPNAVDPVLFRKPQKRKRPSPDPDDLPEPPRDPISSSAAGPARSPADRSG